MGLLINFGAATFKDGVKRIVNKHYSFASSLLRVNQQSIDARSREERKGEISQDGP
jgi:iron complex transport system substrate-binding protein